MPPQHLDPLGCQSNICLLCKEFPQRNSSPTRHPFSSREGVLRNPSPDDPKFSRSDHPDAMWLRGFQAPKTSEWEATCHSLRMRLPFKEATYSLGPVFPRSAREGRPMTSMASSAARMLPMESVGYHHSASNTGYRA